MVFIATLLFCAICIWQTTTSSDTANRNLRSEQVKKEFFDMLKSKLRRKRGDVIDLWLQANATRKRKKMAQETAAKRNWELSTEHTWASDPSILSEYTHQEWNLVNLSANIQNEKPQGHNSPFVLDSQRVEEIRQCQAGFVKPGYWSSFRSKAITQCMVRGAPDRPGLYSRWTDIPRSTSRLLFSSLTGQYSGGIGPGVTDFSFVGDSVSTQLCQYLICDMLRAGASYGDSRSLALRSFDHTVTALSFPYLDKDSFLSERNIRLHNQQFNLPCMRRRAGGCTAEDGERSSYEYICELLRNHSRRTPSLGGHTIVMLNYGLHIKERARTWAVAGMVRALVDVARDCRRKNVTFLFRETSAQTFSYSDGVCDDFSAMFHLIVSADGFYHWDKSNSSAHSEEFCCRLPMHTPHAGNWRNTMVLEYLDRFDSDWREYIGWVPFFNTSLALFDLRVEYHERARHIDCTHFVYTPTAYSALWWDIKRAAEKFIAV